MIFSATILSQRVVVDLLTVSCCGSFNSAWLWTELIYDDNGDGNGEAENVVDVDNVDDDDAGEDDDADDADGDEHLCHSEGHWSNAEVELLLPKRWVDQLLLDDPDHLDDDDDVNEDDDDDDVLTSFWWSCCSWC